MITQKIRALITGRLILDTNRDYGALQALQSNKNFNADIIGQHSDQMGALVNSQEIETVLTELQSAARFVIICK